MKKNILSKLLLFTFLFALITGCATAPRAKDASSAEDFAVITDIRLQDNNLSISSNKQFIYTMYSANDPYKITIEIPDIKPGNFVNKIVSDKAGITEIIPQQVDLPAPAVKVDILLQAPSSVLPVYKDNTLTLMIKPEGPAETKEAPAASEPPPTPAVEKSPESAAVEEKGADIAKAPEKTPEEGAAPMSRATEINKVELMKAADTLKVVIAGNGALMPNVFPIDERIVIDIPGVSMNASLPTDVVSPLKGIRAGKHKDKVRLVLDLKEKTDFEVAAAGNSLEISLKRKDMVTAQKPSTTIPKETTAKETTQKETTAREATPQEAAPQEAASTAEKPAEGKYKGKNISLDFQDAEIGPIFRLLADVNGYNLVLDPSVKGKITIKLMNVPWDQALDIVLNQTHLGYRIEGNILWIAPVSVFDAIVNEKAKSKETEEKAEELMQEIVRINYAGASELSTAITSGKLLSTRGSITMDTRMNTLIIKDTQKSIDKIKELVKIMDVAKPQVMIEAKIVQVSSNYSESLGIRWGGSFASQTWPYPLDGNFSVNTPTVTAGSDSTNSGGALGLTFGHASSMKVNLSLSALESIGKSKTISNPKILTMDNEAATIQQGRTFFIPTVSQAGTQTQPQTATLSLNVTPKITPDGYVQLRVTATDNSLVAGTSGSSAVVDTKSLNTQALVKNGETLVLGGIFTTDSSESEDAVPILGKIPVLSWLFKTRTNTGPDVKELLIFITPTIVSQPS